MHVDMDDVNYSVLTYAASEKKNAMGPSLLDPRSGEILVIGFSGNKRIEELTSTVTYTLVVPSVTLVVSSEVATTLLGKDLIDKIRDKFLIAEVPKLMFVKTLLILVSVPS